MNEKAKIHLSALEMEVVNNIEWLFTKHQIIEKVYQLFGELHHSYRKVVEAEKQSLPSIFQKPGGKISKGENYNGLPYLILDYPAMFSKENIFAVRTMFWWGNFFSISLHLSGSHFKSSRDIFSWLTFFAANNFSICINEKEWEHDFHPSNYIPADVLTKEQIENISKKDFFKVAKKIELSKWDQAGNFLELSFNEIISFIKTNFPNGEKAL